MTVIFFTVSYFGHVRLTITSLRTATNKNICDTTISIATRLWAGWLRNHVEFPARARNSSLLQIIQPIQWLLGALLPRKRQLRHDADNSPPTSTTVRNECSCTSGTPPIPSWHNFNEPSKNNLACKRTPKIYNSGFLKFSYKRISLKSNNSCYLLFSYLTSSLVHWTGYGMNDQHFTNM